MAQRVRYASRSAITECRPAHVGRFELSFSRCPSLPFDQAIKQKFGDDAFTPAVRMAAVLCPRSYPSSCMNSSCSEIENSRPVDKLMRSPLQRPHPPRAAALTQGAQMVASPEVPLFTPPATQATLVHTGALANPMFRVPPILCVAWMLLPSFLSQPEILCLRGRGAVFHRNGAISHSSGPRRDCEKAAAPAAAAAGSASGAGISAGSRGDSGGLPDAA